MARTGVAPIVLCGVAALLATTFACAGHGPSQVSPQEIPNLQARAAKEPGNAALQSRFAAALFAASQFDSARAVAQRALALNPADDLSTLVVGQSLERLGQYDEAIAVYQRFSTNYPKVAAAVRGRELLARRAQATAVARAALRREQELAQQPGDPQTVAVLPLEVVGDSTYQPLGRGLAQMMISDLALLQRFKMVERVQIGAVLDELKFSQTARVDASSAARVGRLVQAGRLVQGVANIPKSGPVRLQATLVQRTGDVSDAGQVNGTMRGLLQLEKDLVVQLAGSMGYTLAEAERQRLLQNGTQNIQAFLAYSKGLLAEDAGDFNRAAAYYGDAVQADPGFAQAREQQQAAAAAPAMQVASSAGQVTGQVQQQAPAAAPSTAALGSGVGELAGNQSEQTAAATPPTTPATRTQASDPPPTTTNQGTSNTVTGTVTIRFRLP